MISCKICKCDLPVVTIMHKTFDIEWEEEIEVEAQVCDSCGAINYWLDNIHVGEIIFERIESTPVRFIKSDASVAREEMDAV